MGNSTMQQRLLSIWGWRGFNNPWMPEADKDVDYSYINLLENPERYTGYKVGHTTLHGSWCPCSWWLVLVGRAAIPAVGTAQAARAPLPTAQAEQLCRGVSFPAVWRPFGVAASIRACLLVCSALPVDVQAAHQAKPKWPLSRLVCWGCSTQLPTAGYLPTLPAADHVPLALIVLAVSVGPAACTC